MRLGIKSMTMDEIARQLGVSKKTIYKYVEDKNDLVAKCLRWQQQKEEEMILQICHSDKNAIDELFDISRHISEILTNVHPSVHFDLERYHPEALRESMICRQDVVYNCIHGNMERGKVQGLYRSDLRSEIIARVYIAKLDVLFDGELFPPDKFRFVEVYLEFFRYHIRGIASEEGLKYLIQKVKKEKQNGK